MAETVWGPGTHLLFSSVPFDSSYRDIVDWESHDQVEQWMMRGKHEAIYLTNTTYVPGGKTVRVSIPMSKMLDYNYLRVRMPKTANINSKWDEQVAYYYFIQDVYYIAPDTTGLSVMLDVWTTYKWDLKIGQVYLERGHAPVTTTWNGRKHSPILREPEGLDLGTDYQVRDSQSVPVANLLDCGVIVTTGADFTAAPGGQGDPHLETAKGSGFERLPNGCDIIVFRDVYSYLIFCKNASKYPWCTQAIQQVMLLPFGKSDDYDALLAAYNTESLHWQFGNVGAVIRETKGNRELESKVMWGEGASFFPNGVPDITRRMDIPRKYMNYSKFATSPYCYLEITNFQGQSLTLRPELLPNGGRLKIARLNHYAPPGQRIVYFVENYLNEADVDPKWDSGSYLDSAITFANFPTFSITNNAGLATLAGQAHSISFARQSASWAQQKALMGSTLSYNQTSEAIASAGRMTNRQNQNRTQINSINAAQLTESRNIERQKSVWDFGIGAAKSLLTGGNPVGVLASGGSALVGNHFADKSVNSQIGFNEMRTSAANNLASDINAIQSEQAAYNRDTNKAYADAVAQGDYENAIAGINAKIQDTELTQPSVAGQVGGDAFMLTIGGWRLSVRVLGLDNGTMERIWQYWARFGYAANRHLFLRNVGLSLMSRFTYWKMKEVHLLSYRCPKSYSETLRGILESGVTVWRKPEDIGYDHLASNEPTTNVDME